MNFDKCAPQFRQSGNAMIYILLALALIALLTASLMRQDSTGGDEIDANQIEFQTVAILTHAASAQRAIEQMVSTASDPSAIDFTLPNATSFDNAPRYNKFYHPEGGGFIFKPAKYPPFVESVSSPEEGWYVGRFNNVEWTKTTAQDIIITAHGIEQAVCANINKKLTGSKDIPELTGATEVFLVESVHGGAANSNFMASNCSDCNGKPALCVSNNGGTVWDFYSIILGR